MRLPSHVRQVDVLRHRCGEELRRIRQGGRDRAFVVEERRRLRERRHGIHRQSLEHRGLGAIAGGEQAALEPCLARPQRHRQDPAHGMDRPVEGELPHDEQAREPLGPDGSGRRQEAERDRQVEADPFLPHVRRGQIDGDPLEREHEPRVPDRRANALPALAHRRIRQADRGERRQPLAHVDLDPHERRLDAGEAGGVAPRQHHRLRKECSLASSGATITPRPAHAETHARRAPSSTASWRQAFARRSSDRPRHRGRLCHTGRILRNILCPPGLRSSWAARRPSLRPTFACRGLPSRE